MHKCIAQCYIAFFAEFPRCRGRVASADSRGCLILTRVRDDSLFPIPGSIEIVAPSGDALRDPLISLKCQRCVRPPRSFVIDPNLYPGLSNRSARRSFGRPRRIAMSRRSADTGASPFRRAHNPIIPASPFARVVVFPAPLAFHSISSPPGRPSPQNARVRSITGA